MLNLMACTADEDRSEVNTFGIACTTGLYLACVLLLASWSVFIYLVVGIDLRSVRLPPQMQIFKYYNEY